MAAVVSVRVLCPRCRAVIEVAAGNEQRTECAACRHPLEVKGGILNVVSGEPPSTPKPPARAQELMESKRVVGVYDVVRKSLSPLASGLSFEKEAGIVLGAKGVSEARRVLDVACGTGVYTLKLARHLSHAAVIGLDLS